MCDSTGEQICQMHKRQTEKNKGFVTINLLSTGEIRRQMWLYILRLLVFVPVSCFPLLFYMPYLFLLQHWAELLLWEAKRSGILSDISNPACHHLNKIVIYSGLLACLNCWGEQGELEAEILISEQPFRFSESSYKLTKCHWKKCLVSLLAPLSQWVS